jgi:two-component system, cell cycle sensor histidine kinase and response regulator CckA
MDFSPTTNHERQRLAVLDSYHILDTPPDIAFDDVAKLACQLCATPVAFISFIDETREWFKASAGFDFRTCPRAASFCADAITQTRSFFEIEDMVRDPRLAHHSHVNAAPQLRFLAGVPLVTPSGYTIGALCVGDVEPRTFSQEQRDTLSLLARHIFALLDAHSLTHAAGISKQSYQALFILSPLPLFIREEATFRFLEINEACQKLYGYTREEFLKMTIYDIRPASEKGRLRRLVTQPNRAALAHSGPWIHRRKNGTLITVEASSHALTFSNHPARLVMVRDITEQLSSEAALRESEERFQLVARATSDAVWDLNVRSDQRWWSDGFSTLFGYPKEEIEPSNTWWAERIHPDERLRVSTCLTKALNTPDVSLWNEEYHYRCKNETYAVVQDRGYIIRDVSGAAVRVVGGMTDITEHKNLLKQSLRAQRMESIGTLAGGIAHDLNNVLSPILMSVELLRLNSPDEASDRLLQTVEKSARRGADLVRQVLTFARGLEGIRVPLSVDVLMQEIVRIAEGTFNRAIRTVLTLPTGLWVVTGDATQLHQVLLNLSINARDAMPNGGVLTFTAQNIVLDATLVGRRLDAKFGPYVCLSISDTGGGIPTDILDRIFEPFFTTKDVGRGTGLGLSTAHAIVKGHGGFITVKSQLKRGTSFHVYLPADPALHAPSNSSAVVNLPRGSGETILIVDDELPILTITRTTLEAFGYAVLTAQNGAEAIALYAQHRELIAAVITDIVMPIMDGPATITALTRINPRVLIAVASGLNVADRLDPATAAHVRYFLAKPFTTETLLAVVHNLLHPSSPTPNAT